MTCAAGDHLMAVRLTEDRIQAILAQSETELSDYRTDDGAMCFTLSAHVVGASKEE